jgi:aconitate hydratase
VPLEFLDGVSVASLGLTGREVVRIDGIAAVPAEVTVRADEKEFRARVRIDTPFEREVFLQGGILPYTLRALAGAFD